jgi:hypothetical protein
MDRLADLKSKIEHLAAQHGMAVYFVGAVEWDEFRQILLDNRVLKIAPSGGHSDTILEIELIDKHLALTKHRNPALTHKFQGRCVTADWVAQFIVHNSELVHKIHATADAKDSDTCAACGSSHLYIQPLGKAKKIISCLTCGQEIHIQARSNNSFKPNMLRSSKRRH